MLIVAGLSLKNLHPRVWDPDSPYYLPELRAVMVSYADFHRQPVVRARAMKNGIRATLCIPADVKIYLDNGAFYFLSQGQSAGVPTEEYEKFVAAARPDWYPIPRDYIPLPRMTAEEKASYFTDTMKVNKAYGHNGYVPVIHIGEYLERYTTAIASDEQLGTKPALALGGIVPNLLRSSKALPYAEVIAGLRHMREAFQGKSVHVFGIGGTATIHIAALLGFDSVDSAGWRNRAARGLIQLPGRGDRMVANLGAWRGRKLVDDEVTTLEGCACPACRANGLAGLRAGGLDGFRNRATHNLWVLLEETRAVDTQIGAGTYATWYVDHVRNSTYRPLIDTLVAELATTMNDSQ